MPSPSQLFLRGGDGVHNSPSGNSGFLSLEPSCTNICRAAHIYELTELVDDGVHKPSLFVPLWGRQLNVPIVDCKVSLEVEFWSPVRRSLASPGHYHCTGGSGQFQVGKYQDVSLWCCPSRCQWSHRHDTHQIQCCILRLVTFRLFKGSVSPFSDISIKSSFRL